MAGTRFDHGGGAVGTTLNANITSGDTSAVIDASTGWPSGGAAGEFWIAIGNVDPISSQFTSNVEKIKVGSRTGTTLSTLTRGADGTTATAHVAGETVRHIFASDEAHQASEHAGDTTRDDHTQYNTPARHAATTHTKAMMGADSVGSAQIEANAVTSSELADDAVDTAAIQNLAVTTAKINDLGVTTAKIADSNVTTAKIADANVTTAKIADANVTAAKLAAAAVTNGSTIATGQALHYVQATNPGAVGANAVWFNTTTRALLVRDSTDTDWEVLLSLGVGINYTPTLTNVTLGAGSYNYGRYSRYGRTIIAQGSVFLGTGGDVTGAIAVSLPVAAADLSATFTGEFGYLGAGRAVDASAAQTWAGVGLVRVGSAATATDRLQLFGTGGSSFWQSTVPFDWTSSDAFTWFLQYESATAVDANFV